MILMLLALCLWFPERPVVERTPALKVPDRQPEETLAHWPYPTGFL